MKFVRLQIADKAKIGERILEIEIGRRLTKDMTASLCYCDSILFYPETQPIPREPPIDRSP